MSKSISAKQPFRYILFYKPYGVVSQFTPEGGLKSLKEFGPFPPDVYPVGRLDADSEGLILLTNDNRAKHRLTDPKYRHPRTYLAQVEHVPEEKDLDTLREGIVLGGEKMMPAEVSLILSEPHLPDRAVPIRFRKNVPTTWIELTIFEGKNRQVRRMTAAIGHPTLRLIRTKISFLSLEGLQPGTHRDLTAKEIDLLRNALDVTSVDSR